MQTGHYQHLNPGQKTVNNYVLKETIGQGMYGQVYRAEHSETHQVFAIKMMSNQLFVNNPRLNEYVQNEIVILKKIRHPNVIRFVEMLQTAKHSYLIYELCNGGDLSQLLKREKRLKENSAVLFFEQLRAAYRIMYQQKILHRDLKPANILLHDGVVKIADFGFCKGLMKQGDMTETMTGSPIYMAPEILRNEPYGAKADIWSLGVILYEMLYGVCPFQENTIPKLIALVDRGLVKYPQEIPVSPRILGFLTRILQIQPHKRVSPEEFLSYPLQDQPRLSEPMAGLSPSLDSQSNILRLVSILRQTYEQASLLLVKFASLGQNIIYARLGYMLWKILKSLLLETKSDDVFWTNQRENVLQLLPMWDHWAETQLSLLDSLGQLLKTSLGASLNPSNRLSSIQFAFELETYFVDSSYFCACVDQLNEPSQLKEKLLLLFMVYKHINKVRMGEIKQCPNMKMSRVELMQTLREPN